MAKLHHILAFTSMLALAPAAQAKDKKPVDPNKKICRADSSTGSIMPSRTCHTAAEWAQIDGTMNGSGRTPSGTGTQRGLGTPGFSPGN